MATELKYTCSNLQQLPEIATGLLEFAGNKRIFLIEAEMGAGKTTLIKELCTTLGSKSHYSSPSFSIVNEYASKADTLYHFDLYRLNSEEELLNIGIEEYLDSGCYCFFEWPKLVETLVRGDFVKIVIEVRDNIRYFRAFVS